jgi:hypothetical protein
MALKTLMQACPNVEDFQLEEADIYNMAQREYYEGLKRGLWPFLRKIMEPRFLGRDMKRYTALLDEHKSVINWLALWADIGSCTRQPTRVVSILGR